MRDVFRRDVRPARPSLVDQNRGAYYRILPIVTDIDRTPHGPQPIGEFLAFLIEVLCVRADETELHEAGLGPGSPHPLDSAFDLGESIGDECPNALSDVHDLVTRLRIHNNECPVRVWIKWGKHQHEAWSAGSDIGDRPGDLGVRLLVREPAGETLNDLLGGVDVVARGQIHVDEKLIAIAVAEHLAYELRSCVAAQDENCEGCDEHNVAHFQEPVQQ